MSSGQSLTSWPDYTTFVNALARDDSAYEWLAAFFADVRRGAAAVGQLNILESREDTLEHSAESLDRLHIPPPRGTTRIVVLSYTEVWSLDRTLLKKIAMNLNLSPYFLRQHLEYQYNHSEATCPDTIGASAYTRSPVASLDTLSLEVGWTPFFHLSAVMAAPQTRTAGPISKYTSGLDCRMQLS